MSSLKENTRALKLLCAALLTVFSFSLLLIHLPERIAGARQSDFPNYYFSGKRFWEGRAIYTPLTNEVKESVGIFHDAPVADTPFLLMLTSPLSFIPYFLSATILLFFSSILFIWTILFFCHEVRLSHFDTVLSLAVGISSSSFLFLLLKNHIEVVVFFLSVAGYIAFRKGQKNLTVLYWGIAASLKLFPLFWFVACFRHLGLRSIVLGLAVFILLSSIGCGVLGYEDTMRFITEVVPASRSYLGTAGNYSLMSFGMALSGISLGWVFSLIGCGLIAYRVIKSESTFGQCWLAGTCGSLILSPLSWLNYFILVLPIIFLLLKEEPFHYGVLLTIAAICLWHFPDTIATGEYFSTVLFSFVPLYCLLYLFAYFTDPSCRIMRADNDHMN